MRVNIAGVGRSGTTAIALYTSYCLALKYGSVWINNEPYTWVSRKGRFSFEGQRYLRETSLLMLPGEELSSSHKAYVRKFSRKSQATLTKFTRAGGFLPYVIEQSQPELNILIVRRVEDVLSSLDRMNWDFFSSYQKYLPSQSTLWKRFANKVSDSEMLAGTSLEISDFDTLERRNALYWYVANTSAAATLSARDMIITFENLRDAQSAINTRLGMEPHKIPPIDSELFRDRRMSNNNTLTSRDDMYCRKLMQSIVNEGVFTLSNALRVDIPLWHTRIGCSNTLTNGQADASSTLTRTVEPLGRGTSAPSGDPIVRDLAQRLYVDLGRSSAVYNGRL